MARTKLLTDAVYSPTIAASEEAIRTQIDDSIQEVLDLALEDVTTNRKLSPTGDFRGTINGGDVTLTEPGLSGAFNAHVAETMQYEGKKFSITNPYKNGGSLNLKGQLHDHTTNSDGLNSPVDLVTAYKNAGFDFISITDHDFLTPDPAVAGIIFIEGVEDTNARHVTAYDVWEQSASTNTQTVIDLYRTTSKLCSIAHPNWGGTLIKRPEMVGYYDYNFIEVFNSFTDTYGENQWDWILSSGKKVFGIAVDDCHDIAAAYFGKGSVVVKANSKDKASIVQSLRDGNFYASSGNDIAVSVAGNVITVSSLASSNFTFIGINGRVLQSNNGVTSASYTIKGDEMYVRVKSVKVSDSTAAWSQPIFIDSIGDDGRTNVAHITEPVSKAGVATRDLTLGAGVQQVRGLGFKPKSLQIIANIGSVAYKNAQGYIDENNYNINFHEFADQTKYITAGFALTINESAGNNVKGAITLVDDGFDITWSVNGTGATGTVTIMYLAQTH
jgi:hypothetical protein